MLFRVFVLLFAISNAQINPVQEGLKHIRSLTFNNFSTIVNQGNDNPWFIKAFAPNCVHCKNFKNDFQKLAFDTRKEETRFASVNCREEPSIDHFGEQTQCNVGKERVASSLFIILAASIIDLVLILGNIAVYHFRISCDN